MSQFYVQTNSGNLPPSVLTTFTGNDGVPNSPVANNLNLDGVVVAQGTDATPVFVKKTSNGTEVIDVQLATASILSDPNHAGLASFNGFDFTVDANGFVSIFQGEFNYTNVVGPTTYTVSVADQFISCDTTLGIVTLRFPNTPNFKQVWYVKDRLGTSSINAIIITTPGGVVKTDGVTSYKIDSNFAGIQLLANATPGYEVF